MVFGAGGELLTSTEHGMDSFITGVEVSEVLKHLCCGSTPGVDEIRLELLKALDFVRLSLYTRLCHIVRKSGTVLLEWQTG